MPQRCKPCQEKAVEQTFVVDSSRLLSFAVGYSFENEIYTYISNFFDDLYKSYRIFAITKKNSL